MKYKNPWYSSVRSEYGPEYFETEEKPVEYKGYQIFERIKGKVWDVVLNHVCVAQRAGLKGSKEAVDRIIEAFVCET